MYFIAYRDKDGKDFNGLPWIEPICEGDQSLAAARNRKSVYENLLTSMVIFECDEYNEPEVITWDFVEQHKVE